MHYVVTLLDKGRKAKLKAEKAKLKAESSKLKRRVVLVHSRKLAADYSVEPFTAPERRQS